MTNLIIPILNTRLLASNYFQKDHIYDVCDLLPSGESGTRPSQYTAKGEWKTVVNFDESNGMCYWRMPSKITSTELDDSLVSSNKYIRLNIPLRLIAVVNRENMNVDSYANSELLANDLFARLNKNLNGSSLRSLIGARQISLSVESLEHNKDEILNAELKKGLTLSPKYVVCAINLSVIIDIQQKCIDSSCNLLTDCQALLASISEIQKNQCILPAYDFSNTSVTDNLTDPQREALIELLCTSDCESIEIENSNGTYQETITCEQSPFQLPGTTMDVEVDGVVVGSVTFVTLDPAADIEIEF